MRGGLRKETSHIHSLFEFSLLYLSFRLILCRSLDRPPPPPNRATPLPPLRPCRLFPPTTALCHFPYMIVHPRPLCSASWSYGCHCWSWSWGGGDSDRGMASGGTPPAARRRAPALVCGSHRAARRGWVGVIRAGQRQRSPDPCE
jgi:hypothetical protein